MSKDEALDKAVDQTFVVLEMAGKNFFKSLREYLAGKNIELPDESKHDIGQMFGDAFKSYLMAEMPAFLCFVLYHRLNNRDILTKHAPDFLDACEAKIGDIPENLAGKTDELPEVARSFLATREQKDDIIESLARDLAGMSQINRLRSSFDALLLTLWGE